MNSPRLALSSQLSAGDLARVHHINARIPGWSTAAHYAFFKSVIADLFIRYETPRILILGVYHGRDIAYMLDIIARDFPGRIASITGVDKFNAEPCDDWPAEKRHLTWEQAFNCPPPDCHTAAVNLDPFNTPEIVATLISHSDADYLAATRDTFDFIYIDTSHDYATVHRQLAQVPHVCFNGATLLAGDDYSDAGTWGVVRAVSQAFAHHDVFANWIWHAPASALLQVSGFKSQVSSQ
jgi:hypothetical protein